jgi:hypothetical protein
VNRKRAIVALKEQAMGALPAESGGGPLAAGSAAPTCAKAGAGRTRDGPDSAGIRNNRP